MTNADKFKNIFGLYATELWSMPEKDFLKWLNSEAMNCSEFPNNSDLISRQAAIDTVMECYDNDELFEVYEWKLNELPPIQPKRGKWNRLDMDTFNCNQCGTTFVLNQGSEKMHFCPNCGAKMEG